MRECKEIEKEIMSYAIDTLAGRVLLPAELSKEELENVVILEKELILKKCHCDVV